MSKVHLRIPYLSFSKAKEDANLPPETLYLASQTLLFQSKKDSADKTNLQKLARSLYKYRSRMCTRPTPFGLFAGIGQVTLGEQTAISLPSKSSYQKHIRLDMNYLCALVRHIETIPSIQAQLRYRINTSLYVIHGKYRYIEHYFDKASKLHKLSAVVQDEYLATILSTAQDGASITLYEDLTEKIAAIGVAFDKSKLFQADMYIPYIEGTVAHQDVKDIEKAIDFLKHFTVPKDNLKQTKEKFTALYEEEEIALFEVFDSENGLDFSTETSQSPLIDKMPLAQRGVAEQKIKQTPQEQYLNRVLSAATENNESSVLLNEKKLPPQLKEKQKVQLPPTYSAMFRVFKEDGAKKLFLESVYGNSAIDLLGRFAHLDAKIATHIKEWAAKERQFYQDKILVDIVHLPEDRTGNVLIRPVLHDYQIAYLSKANIEEEYQIQVSDLMLSLKGNRFVLRSKKLNKEIVPRLSNAHNFSNPFSLPIYRFLCELQNQNCVQWLNINWGNARNYQVFSPRIEYRNVILKLAEWHFVERDIKNIKDALKKNKEAVIDIALFAWQKKYKVPACFILAEGDNELYIDMEDSLSRQVFAHEVKRKTSFVLKEFLMTTDNDTVKGKDGNYAHQFVVSLENKEFKNPSNSIEVVNKPLIQRKFSFGSEWLYYKLYAGTKTAERMLKETLYPLLQELKAENIIDKWFFIRYSDPDKHIRIRLHFTDTKYLGEVIQKINILLNPFLEKRIIHKLQTDTYNRELERYGYNSMLLAEDLFYHESDTIVQFLRLIEGDEGEEIRWLFGLKLIDRLLDDLHFDIDEKIQFATQLKDGFSAEFNFEKAQRKFLNNKYREKRASIERIMSEKVAEDDDWAVLFDLLSSKSKKTQRLIKKLLTLKNENKLALDFQHLVSSYTHMALNRLFASKQRLNETAVYFLLEKYYRGFKART